MDPLPTPDKVDARMNTRTAPGELSRGPTSAWTGPPVSGPSGCAQSVLFHHVFWPAEELDPAPASEKQIDDHKNDQCRPWSGPGWQNHAATTEVDQARRPRPRSGRRPEGSGNARHHTGPEWRQGAPGAGRDSGPIRLTRPTTAATQATRVMTVPPGTKRFVIRLIAKSLRLPCPRRLAHTSGEIPGPANQNCILCHQTPGA